MKRRALLVVTLLLAVGSLYVPEGAAVEGAPWRVAWLACGLGLAALAIWSQAPMAGMGAGAFEALYSGVQMPGANETRFAVLGKQPAERAPHNKTAIMFSATHQPGTSRLDGNQILRDVVDPDQVALRLCTGCTPRDLPGWIQDADQALRYVYVPEDHALAIDPVTLGGNVSGTYLDEKQIIQLIVNKATGRLVVVS